MDKERTGWLITTGWKKAFLWFMFEPCAQIFCSSTICSMIPAWFLLASSCMQSGHRSNTILILKCTYKSHHKMKLLSHALVSKMKSHQIKQVVRTPMPFDIFLVYSVRVKTETVGSLVRPIPCWSSCRKEFNAIGCLWSEVDRTGYGIMMFTNQSIVDSVQEWIANLQ